MRTHLNISPILKQRSLKFVISFYLRFIASFACTHTQDWDEEDDGEWEAPEIPNPKCQTSGCGKWVRPNIKNPNYKVFTAQTRNIINIDSFSVQGKWKPRQIDNPAYKA